MGQATRDFVILPKAVNVPQWIRQPKDPLFLDKAIRSLKYVDDSLNIEKVNMKTPDLMEEEGVRFRNIIAPKTQQLLAHVANSADKTGLMCVSAALSFEARATVTLGNSQVKARRT